MKALLDCKKPKLIWKRSSKNILQINKHIPSLQHLNIIRLTPIKPPTRNHSNQNAKKPMKCKDIRRISSDCIDRNEKNYLGRSKSSFIKDTEKNLECSKNLLTLHHQQRIFSKIQQKNDAKMYMENIQRPQCYFDRSCQRLGQQSYLSNQKNSPESLQKIMSNPSSSKLQTAPSSTFTICNVMKLSLTISKSFYFCSQTLNDGGILNLDESFLKGEQASKVETEESLGDRLEDLKRIISEKQQILQKKQEEIKDAQAKYIDLKQVIECLKRQAQKFADYEKKAISMRSEMENFLYTQPSQILKDQATGFKDKQQSLFNLASRLEFSTYENVLAHLYQEIEVPQKSLFYTVEDFQIKSHSEQDQKLVIILKRKIMSIYNDIMRKIRDILKSKCQKIQLFVKTLRELASYTIGKREYLNQVNSRMVNVSLLADIFLEQLGPQLQQTPQCLTKLKSAVEAMKRCYNEAKIFY